MNIYRIVFLVDIQLANGNAFFIFKKIGVIDIERGLVALDYFYGQAGELFSFYRLAAAAECSTPLEIGMMSGMENLPILEKLLLFKEQHPAIPLHFHLVDFPTLKKRLQQKKLDFALQLELVPLEDTPSLLRAQVGQLRQYVVLNRQSHLSSYASLHRSQLASEQYYVPAMDRELWNQFAQVLTRHGSDPQNIKFAYSMEELMLQLAFYGGYTILAEPVLAQLPANKNLTFIPLENDTVPAWAVWNRENISPALQLLLRELDIDL